MIDGTTVRRSGIFDAGARRQGIMRAATCSALLATMTVAVPARSAETPWALLARNDLRAMRDLIRDNHPGSVDPANPAFQTWLTAGLIQSEKEGAAAKNYADYRRALRRYANGFRDIHVGVSVTPVIGPGVWPGFIVSADDEGAAVVRFSDNEAVLPIGSKLRGCDGLPAEQLYKDRIDPYFYNNDIPHWRRDFYNRLFYLPTQDTKRLRSCTFASPSGTTVTKALEWQEIADGDFAVATDKAGAGSALPPTGISETGGVWYIQIRNFGGGEQQNADLQKLIESIESRAADIRNASKVVIDLRDNPGGNSAWGYSISRALWGDDFMYPIMQSPPMQQTIEYRASRSNRAVYQRYATTPLNDEQTRSYYAQAVADIDQAIRDHKPLARSSEMVKKSESLSSSAPNPMKGRVYVLTRGCGSACLDFLDLILIVPGVTQIGLPTLADAVYTETSGLTPLPSGLAGVAYSMKKIIRRRQHNQWYEPKIRWPGGPMTEDAVTKWVNSLP